MENVLSKYPTEMAETKPEEKNQRSKSVGKMMRKSINTLLFSVMFFPFWYHLIYFAMGSLSLICRNNGMSGFILEL